ncbi:MAG TPA: hypothetical protein ENK98_09090 [Epsilonproteobacteria bacterium]|nr:hypothetical protein [Campylobacterota bacterium]HHD79765.1 hypothetical protein [Campylobacterota bacterium]
MDVKEKVDIIAKQADIIYKKIFIFSAIAGGSWIYGIKTNGYLGIIIWIVFILSAIGLVVNLTRQGTLYIELEEIKNGKS